ncbi:nitroreductase [Sagittula stellata]|uniref:Nitroreductase n=1 Tax=Sagittula stellata (strain ATCC 700073 / DSM 11524 / E-37) TaxID=388399 RepID=A3K001_SAGS3|nr:nitroreductase [Sagittula stellata]EBA09116.1 nitroreductase [Sagittula stellata E-37]
MTMLTHRFDSALSALLPRAVTRPHRAPEVDRVVLARRSTRAFTDQEVDPAQIREILELAARAPSGTNMQPWQAYVITRPTIARIAAKIDACGVAPEKAQWDDYRYYPDKIPAPLNARRRAVGAALYGALGIGRRDVQAMRTHFRRNLDFFGAPVGIFVTVSRRLEQGSWLDLGMFMQTLLLVAEARGLATCTQAAFAPFHKVIRPEIGMGEDEILVCGIALGHAEQSAPENSFRTERAPLDDWARFVPVAAEV